MTLTEYKAWIIEQVNKASYAEVETTTYMQHNPVKQEWTLPKTDILTIKLSVPK